MNEDSKPLYVIGGVVCDNMDWECLLLTDLVFLPCAVLESLGRKFRKFVFFIYVCWENRIERL